MPLYLWFVSAVPNPNLILDCFFPTPSSQHSVQTSAKTLMTTDLLPVIAPPARATPMAGPWTQTPYIQGPPSAPPTQPTQSQEHSLNEILLGSKMVGCCDIDNPPLKLSVSFTNYHLFSIYGPSAMLDTLCNPNIIWSPT